MAEIKLKKRYKYAGDIFQKLIGIGFDVETATAFLNEVEDADVVEVVRCKDCKHLLKEKKICLNAQNRVFNTGVPTFNNHFCSYGTPKERGADKPKITCLNCKHLMFSDMYGECKKQLKTVNPSDTCEYAEPKERGDEK